VETFFSNGSNLFIVYIIVFCALLWFLTIRPQQQRQKAHNQMLANLRVNDRIVTMGGVYGTIVKIKEDIVIVKIADNVRIELLKSAVGQMISSSSDDDEDDD